MTPNAALRPLPADRCRRMSKLSGNGRTLGRWFDQGLCSPFIDNI